MASHNHYSFAETASDIHPGTHDPVALILSQDDLRNATFDCDSAGIHYRIETPTKGIKLTRTTKLYRWDRRTNGEVLVAEWEQNWGTDKMRFLRRADMSQELVPVSNFIKKSCGWLSSRKHTFTGENGKKYQWKVRSSLKLYPNEGDDKDAPIAEFHRRSYIFNKHNAYLQLQPEALEILDSLLLTFLYTEKKRREDEEATSAGAEAAVSVATA